MSEESMAKLIPILVFSHEVSTARSIIAFWRKRGYLNDTVHIAVHLSASYALGQPGVVALGGSVGARQIHDKSCVTSRSVCLRGICSRQSLHENVSSLLLIRSKAAKVQDYRLIVSSEMATRLLMARRCFHWFNKNKTAKGLKAFVTISSIWQRKIDRCPLGCAPTVVEHKCNVGCCDHGRNCGCG